MGKKSGSLIAFLSFLPEILFAFVLISSCSPFSPTNENAAQRIIPEGWQEYANEFTSSIGSLQYSLYYPPKWYVYPAGTTEVNPGSDDLTYIQSYARIGTGDSGFQKPGTIKLRIFALPCNSTEEGCDTGSLSTLASNLPGERKVEELSYATSTRTSTTYWKARILFNDYSFYLQGVLSGTPEENVDQIAILDQILSTLVIK